MNTILGFFFFFFFFIFVLNFSLKRMELNSQDNSFSVFIKGGIMSF